MSEQSIASHSGAAKFTFWQGVLIAVISIMTTILTIGVVWGNTQTRLNYVEAESKENKQKLEQMNSDFNQKLEFIKENMVNKDDFKELKSDVKELIKRK